MSKAMASKDMVNRDMVSKDMASMDMVSKDMVNKGMVRPDSAAYSIVPDIVMDSDRAGKVDHANCTKMAALHLRHLINTLST